MFGHSAPGGGPGGGVWNPQRGAGRGGGGSGVAQAGRLRLPAAAPGPRPRAPQRLQGEKEVKGNSSNTKERDHDPCLTSLRLLFARAFSAADRLIYSRKQVQSTAENLTTLVSKLLNPKGCPRRSKRGLEAVRIDMEAISKYLKQFNAALFFQSVTALLWNTAEEHAAKCKELAHQPLYPGRYAILALVLGYGRRPSNFGQTCCQNLCPTKNGANEH
eukprot:1189836-Prorocentrum_minimum.AAC.6